MYAIRSYYARPGRALLVREIGNGQQQTLQLLLHRLEFVIERLDPRRDLLHAGDLALHLTLVPGLTDEGRHPSYNFV